MSLCENAEIVLAQTTYDASPLNLSAANRMTQIENCYCYSVITPSDVVVARRRTYFTSFCYLLSFFSCFRQLLRAHLTELNQNRPQCSEVSAILKIHVQNDVCLLLKIGGPKRPIFGFFRRPRNLMANSTAYIIRMKHDVDNRVNVLEITGSLLYHLEIS